MFFHWNDTHILATLLVQCTTSNLNTNSLAKIIPIHIWEEKNMSSLRCIENLYDKIFNVNSGDGQNLDLIQQTIHNDWKIRPKLKKNEPEGPQGLKHMMAHYSVMFHDLHFMRKQTLSSR